MAGEYSPEELERLGTKVGAYVEDDGTIVGAGPGESPAVKALLSKDFADLSNLEALDIGTAIQLLVRQNNSILSKMDQRDQFVADEFRRLKARMDEREQAEKEWNEDRKKFLKELKEKADPMRIQNPEAKQKFLAIKQKEAQAQANIQRAKIQAKIDQEQKETVTSPGKIVTIRDGSSIRPVLVGEKIKIAGRTWVLPPGVPTKVPKSVAARFRDLQRNAEEQAERKSVLSARNQDTQMVPKWNDLNRRYSKAGDLRVESH